MFFGFCSVYGVCRGAVRGWVEFHFTGVAHTHGRQNGNQRPLKSPDLHATCCQMISLPHSGIWLLSKTIHKALSQYLLVFYAGSNYRLVLPPAITCVAGYQWLHTPQPSPPHLYNRHPHPELDPSRHTLPGASTVLNSINLSEVYCCLAVHFWVLPCTIQLNKVQRNNSVCVNGNE